MAFTQLLTLKELSAHLGISYARAYNLSKIKGFPKIKIGSRNYYRPQSIQRWLDEQESRSQS